MFETDDKDIVRKAIDDQRRKEKTIGFVPTMGALHDGHLSLVRQSKKDCNFTVVSIFVNPAQFAPTEDFEKYPRDYEKDKNLLKSCGVDMIFLPTRESVYSSDFSTWVVEDNLSQKLCGRIRKGHFRGVLTIVAKLFLIVLPDVAYFGQKDYQQAALIKKMVRELDFPLRIDVLPTVREKDGLAMSSRNMYLNSEQRRDALVFSKTLWKISESYQAGEIDKAKLIDSGKKYFVENSGCAELEYLEILDSENLDDIDNISGKVVVAIAGKVGETRLIDNIILPDQCSCFKNT